MSRASDAAGYAAFRLGSAACRVAPESVARRSGELVGYVSSFLLPRRFARAQSHMRRVLGDGVDTRGASRALFASYGRYWAETFWMRPHRTPGVLAHVTIDGDEHLRAARAAGRGMILALPHIGNFEIGSLVASAYGLNGLGIAEALPNRRITEWFVRARGAMGTRTVLSDAPDMRVLIDHLRSGGAVGIMSDRGFNGQGVPVTFFGSETLLPPGAAALALRTDAPLLPIVTYFRPGRGHHVVVRPPLPLPKEGSRKARIARGTQLLATAIEEFIRAHPTQWHNLQPNWPGDP